MRLELNGVGLELHHFYSYSLSPYMHSLQVLFDRHGCLKRYSSATEILTEFFDLRLDMYQRRKHYLEGMLTAEASKLTNQARFIVEKIEGKIVVGGAFYN